MLRRIYSYLFFVSVLMFAASASANTVYGFSQSKNNILPFTAATLEISQSGADTLFTLTGSFSDLGSNAFIKEIFFSGPGGDFSSVSGNTISNAIYSANGISNNGNQFNWDVEFPAANGPTSDRFLANDTVSWKIAGTDASLFLNTADYPIFIKFNAVAGDGSSGKLFSVITSPVPEPQAWFMILAGMAMLGWNLRRRS